MVVKDARVDVVLQRIEEDVGDEVELEPKKIRRYGVNNIFQRTLSYLFGWTDDDKPIKLRANSAGWLKVATTAGTAYEHMERESGIAAEAKSDYTVFDNTVSHVDVYVKDFEMWFYASNDGVNEEDPIRCLPNIRNVFEITVHSFKVQRAGLNDVEYEVVGAR